MEKEFIPYEQALALKELGFDEPCFATIDQTDYLHINGTKELPRGAMMYDTIDCATFSQAFRWFREPKNGSYNHLDFMYEYLKDDSISYEKAELECLKKLIEITKNK